MCGKKDEESPTVRQGWWWWRRELKNIQNDATTKKKTQRDWQKRGRKKREIHVTETQIWLMLYHRLGAGKWREDNDEKNENKDEKDENNDDSGGNGKLMIGTSGKWSDDKLVPATSRLLFKTLKWNAEEIFATAENWINDWLGEKRSRNWSKWQMTIRVWRPWFWGCYWSWIDDLMTAEGCELNEK